MALRHQAWVAASQSCGPVSLHAGASTYKVSVWRAALYSPLRSARGRRGQGHCAESRSPVGLAKPQGLGTDSFEETTLAGD